MHGGWGRGGEIGGSLAQTILGVLARSVGGDARPAPLGGEDRTIGGDKGELGGRPVNAGDKLRLVDDQGRDVAPGEIGELLCRGPYSLRGYFRVPEQNLAAFTKDGFFKTGDLMRLHPSGNHGVEGRRLLRGGVRTWAGNSRFLCCRKDQIDEVHFDTRQFNHIVWETPEDLREQLIRRIKALNL